MQDSQAMVESSDKMWSTGEGNGKPLQYFCLEYPMNSMKRQKQIEENNRILKTRDLFKKIRDTKGTFHAKTGTIKDRNGMDLREAKGIKKRWQEYTEELYKKELHNPDNHNGVITHLKPDIWNVKSSGA